MNVIRLSCEKLMNKNKNAPLKNVSPHCGHRSNGTLLLDDLLMNFTDTKTSSNSRCTCLNLYYVISGARRFHRNSAKNDTECFLKYH